jgi:hypothetical protein
MPRKVLTSNPKKYPATAVAVVLSAIAVIS